MHEGGKTTSHVVVTGDVVVDHHIYDGERRTLAESDHRFGVREWRELGGAPLVKEMLARLIVGDGDNACAVHFGLPPASLDSYGHRGYARWRPNPRTRAKDAPLVWRAEPMGYGHWGPPGTTMGTIDTDRPPRGLPPADVLVLDDAGAAFRGRAYEKLWLLPSERSAEQPRWILHEMSSPVVRGDLWHSLHDRFADRLVCLVSADALRQESVALARGLSWEHTIEGLREGLRCHPELAQLEHCRHLIVNFSADGALWVRRSDDGRHHAVLCFDAAGADGDYAADVSGAAIGTSVPLTAAIAHALARHAGPMAEEPPDLVAAIKGGLAGVRNLRDLGHGPVEGELPTGFPTARIAAEIARPGARAAFSDVAVPWSEEEIEQATSARRWMIVETSQRPLGSKVAPSLAGLARQVALRGYPALKRLPHALFGDLVTADRDEIEALRTLKRLIVAYREQDRRKTPLSIGVFGPPGAGKSFGVKQIARGLSPEPPVREFNLSQFSGPTALLGPFHEIRDLVLKGEMPIVFWDEFDSREYDWLQYLLAPMQDGRFQEGELNHTLGKCVFVFAGGTSPTFEDFGPLESDREAWPHFELLKGPDFRSRLDAYYDVAGPNRRTVSRSKESDPADVCYSLRRALLLRSLLRCKPDERLDIDPYLLEALLTVRKFTHGSRSLEKVVEPLRPGLSQALRRSFLPAPAQLAMHVGGDFKDILDRNQGFNMPKNIEILAAGIHETWRALSRKQGGWMHARLDRPYAELPAMDQEDNRAAARRIPEVLGLAGMGVADNSTAVRTDDPSLEETRVHIEHHLERLAEAEHDGWMEQRVKNGWRQGTPRNDDAKVHPLIVPYEKLPEKEKNKDRSSVRNFPDMVAMAGHRIVWLRDDSAAR